MARIAFDGPYKVFVVGEAKERGDLYHRYLRMGWLGAIGVLANIFLLTNLGFATAYYLVGGIVNARPGSFLDLFFFSVDTMATIGYGAMYPGTPAAHALVTLESFAGMLFTGLSAGLFFSKVAQRPGRLAFSTKAVVTKFEGVRTLMFRLGNSRSNNIIEASVRVDMVRTVKDERGSNFYKQIELPLLRNRSAALARSWTVMHPLDDNSPLKGATAESLARDEIEFSISVVGLDDTSGQTVFGRHTYTANDVVFGARYKDILHETPQGDLVLDVRDFNVTEPE